MRFDIVSKNTRLSSHLSEWIFQLTQHRIESIIEGRSYWVEMEKVNDHHIDYCHDLFRDHVDQAILFKEQSLQSIDFDYLIEVSFKPGVTDNTARSSAQAIKDQFELVDIQVATGELYFIKSQLESTTLLEIATTALANDLIQQVQLHRKSDIIDFIPSPKFPKVKIQHGGVQTFDFNMNLEKLVDLSKQNLWALSSDELKQIQEYFNLPATQKDRKNKNLPLQPTDIEIEIIAQTWSEHCKHKIFAANIEYTEDETAEKSIGNKKVNGVFKSFIKKSTDELIKNGDVDWAISIFTDNAGVVRFDDHIDYCFKVETHNSPSALDPYGGALTGILGVNRDILGCGIGARPIANTNVLCFAPYDYPQEIKQQIPAKLKNPLSILKGVHRGILDGGNKSGIPTVNGAVHFHDDYVGKPLVYCGTVGVLPHKLNGHQAHLKRHRPGDAIVVCGGSVGADGIHGATFSSLELDDNAPSTAVQIGDPLTQKRLTDFLLEARDLDLYNSLTDNGAGGLSSSVGEMAEHTNGARLDITKVPLKYQGLAPFEIIISESQERMTFSVPQEKLADFIKLAKKRDCNPAIIGEFHSEGSFDIYSEDKLLASLSLSFLHDELRPMELTAHYSGPKEYTPWHKNTPKRSLETLEQSLQRLISHHNIQSKEKLIRQYDHEVKASTITKPLIKKKKSGPSDGAVIWGHLHGGSATSAICISNGLAPQVSHIDTYKMTQFAIDEAIRNAVASGANPNFICLCDNYCWPDPIKSSKTPDGEYKLAQLVRSGQALYDTAMAYKTPFVSGKDSMKNDFIGENRQGKQQKISVPPTLLISALGKVDHIDHAMTTDFKRPEDSIYYIGPQDFEKLYYSHYAPELLTLPKINLDDNKQTFILVHQLITKGMINACHDVSEGGILTAVIESLFPNNLGLILLDTLVKDSESLAAFLFNEIPGGFVVGVNKELEADFLKLTGARARKLGQTTRETQVIYRDQLNISTAELYEKWSQHEY